MNCCSPSEKLLLKASDKGDIELVKKILTDPSNVDLNLNCRNKKNWTPLYIASSDNNAALVKLLLQYGAQVDATSVNNSTALHVAAYWGCVEVAEVLLAHGAETALTDFEGKTALLVAIEENEREVADLILLKSGFQAHGELQKFYPLCSLIARGDVEGVRNFVETLGDANFREFKLESPLYYACVKNEPRIVRLLLEFGAEVDRRNCKKAQTALHASCNCGSLECVNALLRHGASVSLRDVEGDTALHLAARRCDFEIVKKLLESGASPNSRNLQGATPLMIFVGRFRVDTSEALELFKRNRANFEARDRKGRNLLHYAAENEKSSGPLEELLKLGKIDANLRDEKGNTPLHVVRAKFCGPLYCENYAALLRHGADVNLQNSSGERPVFLRECMEDQNHACLALIHFKKLRLLDYRINEATLDNVPEDYYQNDELVEEFRNELEVFKRIVISSYPLVVTLYDFLLMNRNRLARFSRNKVIVGIRSECGGDFRNRFSHYGFLLNLLFKKGRERREMMNSVQTCLCLLSGDFCIPDEKCAEKVFKYLSDSELRELSFERLLIDCV